MHQDHWLRKRAIKIEESEWFNNVMLIAIVINVVFLGAAEDPRRRTANRPCRLPFPSSTTLCSATGTTIYWLVYAGYALFTVIFWLEMIIHVLAMGFRNFSRSGWRLLDFVLNIIGYYSSYLFNSHHSLVYFLEKANVLCSSSVSNRMDANRPNFKCHPCLSIYKRHVK